MLQKYLGDSLFLSVLVKSLKIKICFHEILIFHTRSDPNFLFTRTICRRDHIHRNASLISLFISYTSFSHCMMISVLIDKNLVLLYTYTLHIRISYTQYTYTQTGIGIDTRQVHITELASSFVRGLSRNSIV